MLTRLIGCDAEMEFTSDLLDAVKKAEAAFPAPEFAVIFSDAQSEDEDDTLMIARRYNGVLISMVYITLDEIDAFEDEGHDWIADITADLARPQEAIDDLELAEDTEEN